MEPDVGAGGAVAGGYSAGADADASPARLGARRRFGSGFGSAGEEDREHAGGGRRTPGGCGDFCCRPDWFLGAGCPADCAPPVEHSGYGDVAFGVAGFGYFGAG